MQVMPQNNPSVRNFNSLNIETSSSEHFNLINEDLAGNEIDIPFNQDWDVEDKRRNKRIQKVFPSKCQKKSFKEAVRQGISQNQRKHVYLFLAEIHQKYNDFEQYWENILAENSVSINEDNIVSMFGFPDYELFTPKDYLQNFLTIFQNQIQENIFSPLIPCVASILSLSLEPKAAYFVLKSMYDQGSKYFTKTKREFAITLKTVEHSLSLYTHLFHHAKSLKINFSEIALFLMPLLFSKRVDKRVSLTIFDSFMYYGKYALVRYIIGIIISVQSKLLQTKSATEFMSTILDYVLTLNDPSKMNYLIHTTFSARHSKNKKIEFYELEQEQKMKKFSDPEINQMIETPLPTIEKYDGFHQLTPLFGPTIRSVPLFHENTVTIDRMISQYSNVNNGALMTNMEFYNLKTLLPFYLRKFNAYSIYRKSVDGSSINEFLTKCKKANISILLIKTKSKTIGALLTEPLKIDQNGLFKGSDTFVFDLTNNAVYRKTKNNHYCISIERNSITIGGGESGSAIYIDQYFTHCSSYPCETFDSPALLSPYSKEEIEDLEVFRLGV